MWYFDRCNSLVSTTPYYYCVFDLGLVPAFFTIQIVILVFKFLTRKRKNPSAFLREGFRKSIFSYLERNYPRSSFAVYLLMTYGVFTIRPVGYLISFEIFTGAFGKAFGSITVNSITTTFYFFTVVFMANFYGVKSEIMNTKGDPIVEENEREPFLRMVMRRSISFSLIFFIASILNICLKNPSFTYSVESSHRAFDWALRTLSYGFIAVLVINRLRYVRHVTSMIKLNAIKKNKIYNDIAFNRHIQSHLLTPEILLQIVRGIRSEREDVFLSQVTKTINMKCKQSSFLFEEKIKIINNKDSPHQEIVRNPMENHLFGSLWLYFTLIDALYNSLASPMILLYDIIRGTNSSTQTVDVEQEPFPFVLTMIMFGFYTLETTLQAIIVNLIVRNKINFGDHIEVDSYSSRSHSEDLGINFSLGEMPGGEINQLSDGNPTEGSNSERA